MRMTQEKYFKVLPFVWVAKYRCDINKSGDYRLTYRFSKDMPPKIPNPSMTWQKPTYEELLIINKHMMKSLGRN